MNLAGGLLREKALHNAQWAGEAIADALSEATDTFR